MTRIATGLVAIDAGETIVTGWIGDADVVLSETTAPASSSVVIEGIANFIKARISTTSFELVLPHAGAGGADLACAISALTSSETSIGTLNGRVATTIQQLNVLDANGRGLFYNLIGVTGDNDPGPGNMAFDNAVPALITELYFDVLDANDGGRDVAGLIGLWEAGTVLIVRSLASGAYVAVQLKASAVGSGGWRRVQLEPVGSDGTLANEPVAVEWRISGSGMQIGAIGPIVEREGYDEEDDGFVYASIDGDGETITTSVLFQRRGATAGIWSPALPFQGVKGDPSTVPGPSGPPGIFWQPAAYDPDTMYALNDGVLDNGSSWRALGPTIGNAPPVLPTTSNAFWQLLARKGTDGTGAGDLVGPAVATLNAFALFADTTGKLLKTLSYTAVTALLNAFVGDSSAGGTKGLVPAPAAGDSAAGKVLGAGGGWVVPASVPRGHIYGLTLSNNVPTDTVNDVDIAVGEAASDDASPFLMKLASAFTKRTDAAWAVGSGNFGGWLDGSAMPNGTGHVFLIQRSDTGVIDIGISASATAPPLPTNYDRKRRIGSIIRASGAILPFSQLGNEFLLKTPVNDIVSSPPVTTAVLAAITVPNGIQVTAIVWVFLRSAENVRRAVLITSPDQTAVAPAAGTMSTFATGLDGIAGGTTTGEIRVRTNTSKQFRYQMDGASAATALFMITTGWIDAI